MGRHTAADALYKDKAWLKNKYLEDKLSSLKIAKLCGVRNRAILYYLHKFGLMQPSRGERVLITSQVEQLIIGTVLGDASLPLSRLNPRLSVGHREEDIDYLLWKYLILASASLVKAPIRPGTRIATFETVSSPLLRKYRELFYKEGHKVLSKKALKMLTPFSLAIWYMDDGNFFQVSKHSARLKISTDGFSKRGVDLTSVVLEQKFGFHFRVHCHKKGWVLQMSDGNEIIKFLNTVRPYIHPAMARKCPDFIPITESVLSKERSQRAKELWKNPQVRQNILLGQEKARASR